jgi:hypothetical protein
MREVSPPGLLYAGNDVVLTNGGRVGWGSEAKWQQNFVASSTLKMEVMLFSETSVTTYNSRDRFLFLLW